MFTFHLVKKFTQLDYYTGISNPTSIYTAVPLGNDTISPTFVKFLEAFLEAICRYLSFPRHFCSDVPGYSGIILLSKRFLVAKTGVAQVHLRAKETNSSVPITRTFMPLLSLSLLDFCLAKRLFKHS
jgi:hypothetical protein